MSNTKATRRGDLLTYSATYKIPLKLSQGEIDECVDQGKYDVFFDIFAKQKRRFLVTTDTFSDGDPWPDGGATSSQETYFFGLAGRQYIAGTPPIKIRFARPSMIAIATRNNRILGTTEQPVLYLSDRKFHFLPNTIEGANIDYYAYPAPLAASSVADNATDTMPVSSEPEIARAGFERMLKKILSNQAMVQLTQQEIARTEEALKDVFEKKYLLVNQEPGERE